MSGKNLWLLWFDDIKMKNLSPVGGLCPLLNERDLITRPLESTMDPGDYWSILQEMSADQVLRYIAAESGKGLENPGLMERFHLAPRRQALAPLN